ncbi:glycosyltransferase family 2 protein [Ramlibacter sp. AN1015]|uniref:glycosyltransferase family 2 protein n=1 Tax=Ramlibacter sp. AN1015 TaxID=3133428 RepID=UPI0030C5FA4F
MASFSAARHTGPTAAGVLAPESTTPIHRSDRAFSGALPPPAVRFSVVMPLYNKSAYVRAAVDSVLAQSFRELELIVVDDGSTDDSTEQLRDIDDPRLRLLRQPNAGVSAARNRGIEAAQGEWVCFLDADDLWHAGYLASLAAAQQTHPTLSVVGTRYTEFVGDALPDAHAAARAPTFELIEDLPTRWRRAPAFFTSSVAVRAALLKRMQPCFPPGEAAGEDLDLWFRLGERQPIGLLHRSLVARRVGLEGSLSAAHLRACPPFVERMRARALASGVSRQQRRSTLLFVAHLVVDLARSAAASGERVEAMRWLLKAPEGMRTRRWWVALSMAACWPQKTILSFQAKVQPGYRPLAPALAPDAVRIELMRLAGDTATRAGSHRD